MIDTAQLKVSGSTPDKTTENNMSENIFRNAVITSFKGKDISMFYVGKKNGKLGVLKDGEFFYCIPNTLNATSRKDLEPLALEANTTGTISIESIMAFEYNCKKK